MKRWSISMLLALTLTVLLTLTGFDAHCDTICTHVLRLHILANSDSDADQAMKLALRDRLLSECGDLFAETADYDAALAQAQENLPALEAAARRELAELGCALPVTVRLAPADFDTRRYGDVTLPAGRYTALQVTIGKGEGHNWWCVLYPGLCFLNTTNAVVPEEGKQKLKSVLTEEEYEQITSTTEFHIRWKLLPSLNK